MKFIFRIKLLRNMLFLALPAALLLLFSCEKPEGPGGRGIIRGQVIVKSYDEQFRVLQSEVPAADRDVYIKYGNTQNISDDRNTSPDGSFEFKYLSKGDYTVLVYSDDTTGTSPSGQMTLEYAVSLSSKKEEHDLGKIYIYKALDFDDGLAIISGQVMQINYSRDYIYPVDTIAAQNKDIFLVYEDDLHYADRIRTQFDGSFAFPNLIKGDYSVYAYSEDINRGAEDVPVLKNITVDAVQGVFDTGILYTAKEN